MSANMNISLKQILTATAAAILVAASSASAWADGRGYGNYGRSGGYSERYSGGHGGYNNYRGGYNNYRGNSRYNNRGYGGRSYYGGSHGNRYHTPGYGQPYNHRHGYTPYRSGIGSGGYFVLGAATGLVLGSIIAQPPEREVVYTTQTTYVTPPPANQVEYQTSSYQLSANCLQTREYTTTIIVGGREEEAYGTACLQSDGSWLQGPPQVVPR